MDHELGISARADGETCTVVLDGDLDVYASAYLKTILTSLVDEGSIHLMLDLRNVAFMDSSDLGVLVSVLRRTREKDGEVRLLCADNGVLKILRITGLDRAFAVSVERR